MFGKIFCFLLLIFRWGTHLNYSLLLSVRPEFGIFCPDVFVFCPKLHILVNKDEEGKDEKGKEEEED